TSTKLFEAAGDALVSARAIGTESRLGDAQNRAVAVGHELELDGRRRRIAGEWRPGERDPLPCDDAVHDADALAAVGRDDPETAARPGVELHVGVEPRAARVRVDQQLPQLPG